MSDIIVRRAAQRLVLAVRGAKGDTGPAGSTTWAAITGKPTEFPPEAHTHTFASLSMIADDATVHLVSLVKLQGKYVLQIKQAPEA